VLELDGQGDYVRCRRRVHQFPPGHHRGVGEVAELTVGARVFDFGAPQREMYVSTGNGGTPNSAGMKFLVVDAAGPAAARMCSAGSA
jgi:hypothetical protein